MKQPTFEKLNYIAKIKQTAPTPVEFVKVFPLLIASVEQSLSVYQHEICVLGDVQAKAFGNVS